MVSVLVYNSKVNEVRETQITVKELAARMSEEKWETSCFSSLKEIRAYFETQPLINMACYDVTQCGSLEVLGNIRKGYSDMLLMLIADDSLSPMDYVRPDILASSLIIRPYSKELLKDKWRDLINKYLSKTQGENPEEAFIVETREGKTRVPYNQIFYVEARDKKLFLRLRNSEIAFYGTLEELEEILPSHFMRCHRSFLMNQMHLEKVLLSQGEIQLSHGITVPLSRSYKPQFKSMR